MYICIHSEGRGPVVANCRDIRPCQVASLAVYRGTTLRRDRPPPYDHHMTLGKCYGRVPGGGSFS